MYIYINVVYIPKFTTLWIEVLNILKYIRKINELLLLGEKFVFVIKNKL